MTESPTGVASAPSVDEMYLAALKNRAPDVQAIARWFRSDHLPTEALHHDVASEFQTFALCILDIIREDSPEIVVALHKLLEAKDAAVRATLS